jgi:hypothetical protein
MLFEAEDEEIKNRNSDDEDDFSTELMILIHKHGKKITLSQMFGVMDKVKIISVVSVLTKK